MRDASDHGPAPQASSQSASCRSRAKSSPSGQAAWAAVKVDLGPIAVLGRRGGVLAAGLGPVAVVLVIGQEPGRVAGLDPDPSCHQKSAVVVGAVPGTL